MASSKKPPTYNKFTASQPLKRQKQPSNLRTSIKELREPLKQFLPYSRDITNAQKMKASRMRLKMDTSTIEQNILADSSKMGKKIVEEQQQKLQTYYQLIKEMTESDPNFFKISSPDDKSNKIGQIEAKYGVELNPDDTETIFKLGKWATSSRSNYKKVFEEGLQFSESGEISHIDPYVYENPLKMVLQFLGKIESTSTTLQKPVYVLQSTRQMNDDISYRFKYEHDSNGNVANVDRDDPSILTDTYINDFSQEVPIDRPDGKDTMLEMMSDPDPIIGNIRIRDVYPTINELIQSQLRNEYFSIPIISKQIDERTGEIVSGNIDVQINPKLSAAVENYELMVDGTIPMTDDVSELPIYFSVSSVYDTEEIITMTEYILNLIKTQLDKYGIISDDTIKEADQQAAAGRHSALLLLYKREVYSIGYSTMGGKVDGVDNKLLDIFNKFVGATKGLIATRDYYIDIDEENTNLHVSDVGVLRRKHLDNLINYSRGANNRGGFGYVSVGGLAEDSPNNAFDKINELGNGYNYDNVSPEEQNIIIDEIAKDEEVREYYENEYFTNYGTQFFLPNDAYVFQTSESTLLSDFVSVFSTEYSNMLSHYGTNCARFIQSILNDRITCGLAKLSIPSQCKRLPHLIPVDGDYLIKFFKTYITNDVGGLLKHCQCPPYEPKSKSASIFGLFSRTGGKTTKKQSKRTKTKAKKNPRKSRKNLTRK